MIGDGMGVSQVTSAFYFGEGKPNFQNFKSVGLSETSCTSDRLRILQQELQLCRLGRKLIKEQLG
jgi:alkaline phosphatase